MSTIDAHVTDFFDRYASALLARDAAAIARMYAVPALILFPGNAGTVTDAAQTEQFFASAWSQYDGVDTAEPTVIVMGAGPQTVWADVTWRYDGQPRERFCYQLVGSDDEYRIAVLTPLDVSH